MMFPTLLVVLAVGWQDADTAPWTTVISQEGQFIVDFPTRPTGNESRTMNGPSGRTKAITVECDTPSVAYVAQKVILTSSVVRGAEERVLDVYRAIFTEIYNGKVISEKKVRLNGAPGRDFTVRGRAGQRGREVVTIRIRMFLAGQAIYALQAIAAPNRELPPEVSRFFGSFTVGTKRIKKSGPKEDEPGKEIAGWGEGIDPDGDCAISTSGKALTMTIPGSLHDLNADIDKYNSPRVLREVSGNFFMQVKVVGEFKPGTKSTNPKSVPYNGAGLFVWRDSDNFIRLERGAIVKSGKLSTFATFEERDGGSRGAVHNDKLTPGAAYLRLERRGSRIFGFTSKDGKNWAALKPIDTVWPAELKVGLNAINSGNAPFNVRFEDFVFKGKPPAQ